MFTEPLDRVLVETPGAVMVTLMGFDGIAIETRERGDDAEKSTQAQTAVIELGAVAIQLKRVVEGLGAGDVQEFTVQTGDLTTVLRPLTPEYFLALALEPAGLVGKGRYLMRVVSPALLAALA